MVSAVVLTATGVNADGHREVLGLRVATTESSAAWNGLLADLVARGLTGVRLVTSDLTRDTLVGCVWAGVSFRWYCGVGGLVVGH